MTFGAPHRSVIAGLPALALALAATIASCSGDPPTSPARSLELNGIELTAEATVVGPSAERLQEVRLEVRLTNTTSEPVSVPVRGCTVLLRVRAPEGRVVWGEDRGDWECQQDPFTVALGAGESRAIEGQVDTWRILGDSIPPGPYRFSVLLQLQGKTVELEAGAGELGTGLEDLSQEIVSVVEGDPAQLRIVVTVINDGEREALLEYGCGAVRLLVFRSADRSGRPAWDSDHRANAFGNPFVCPAYLATHVLEPGESFSASEFRYVVPVREILGDSLPDGRYFFSIDFQVNFRTTRLPVGDATLSR